jgi:hypothetical protein
MAWVEEKTREGGLMECLRRGERALGDVVGSVGPDGGAWHRSSACTTRTHGLARTVREGGTDRPSVLDTNISPFSKFQT